MYMYMNVQVHMYIYDIPVCYYICQSKLVFEVRAFNGSDERLTEVEFVDLQAENS